MWDWNHFLNLWNWIHCSKDGLRPFAHNYVQEKQTAVYRLETSDGRIRNVKKGAVNLFANKELLICSQTMHSANKELSFVAGFYEMRTGKALAKDAKIEISQFSNEIHQQRCLTDTTAATALPVPVPKPTHFTMNI